MPCLVNRSSLCCVPAGTNASLNARFGTEVQRLAVYGNVLLEAGGR